MGVCVCVSHLYVSVFNVGVIWVCVKIWREKTVTSVNTPAQCMHLDTVTHEIHTLSVPSVFH